MKYDPTRRYSAAFQVVERPIRVWRPYASTEKSGEIFRHRVHPSPMLQDHERKEMEEYCRATFGPGGRMPGLGNQWFIRNDDFCFRKEEDMTMFVMAFRG
jgi:hypothetical protein